jgi:predicted amidohydrolase
MELLSDLRVSAVQTDIFWQDVNQNLDYLDLLLAPLSGSTDLIVLPEMFTSGFTMNPSAMTSENQEKTLSWLKEKARLFSSAICGSMVFAEENKYYNRFIWVHPEGQWYFYDKQHLFSYAGEDRHYAAGKHSIIIEYKGWWIFPQICYDLRFSESSRNVSGNYDVLLYVANFPAVRQYAWNHLLIARAIENQAYTIGVNRVGIDGNQHRYDGGSVILSYEGVPLLQGGREEQILTYSLNLERQNAFRTQFPFLQDIKLLG